MSSLFFVTDVCLCSFRIDKKESFIAHLISWRSYRAVLDFILRFLLFQGVAMACGFLVVIALGVTAFFAQRTRGKIWRYGKPNIYWEEPLVGGKASEGRDVEDWVRVNCVQNTV